MGKARKQKFEFKGEINDDSILVGSHGDAVIKVEGTFNLSGIIYCPKHTVTITIRGNGRVAFRGKCRTLVIKKMKGDCTLDLSELTCTELQGQALKQKATVIVGKTRVITRANLADEAEMYFDAKKPLITSSLVTGNSRIVHRSKVVGSTADDVVSEE